MPTIIAAAAAVVPPESSPGAQPWTTVLDGQRLREARRRSGLSQERLAYQAGLSLTTVARLERQRRPHCRTRTLARLAAALGETPAAIVPLLVPAPVPAPALAPASAPPLAPARRPVPAVTGAGGTAIPRDTDDTASRLLASARLSIEFEGYHIRVERTRYRRRPRYVAIARSLAVRPYAVVSADAADLREALAAGLAPPAAT